MAPTASALFKRSSSEASAAHADKGSEDRIVLDFQVPYLVYSRASTKKKDFTLVAQGFQKAVLSCPVYLVKDSHVNHFAKAVEDAYGQNPCLVLVTGDRAVCYTADEQRSDPFAFRRSSFDRACEYLDAKAVKSKGSFIVEFESWLVSFTRDRSHHTAYMTSLDPLTCFDSSFPYRLNEKMVGSFLHHWKEIVHHLISNMGYVRITAGAVTHSFCHKKTLWVDALRRGDEDQPAEERDDTIHEECESVWSCSESSASQDDDACSQESEMDLELMPMILEREVVQGLQKLDLYLMCGTLPEPALEDDLKHALDELDAQLQHELACHESGSWSDDESRLRISPRATQDAGSLKQHFSASDQVLTLRGATYDSNAAAAHPRMSAIISHASFTKSASSFGDLSEGSYEYPEDLDSSMVHQLKELAHSPAAHLTEVSELDEAKEGILRGSRQLAERHVPATKVSLERQSTQTSLANVCEEVRGMDCGESLHSASITVLADTPSRATIDLVEVLESSECDKFIPSSSSEALPHVRSMGDLAGMVESVPAGKPSDLNGLHLSIQDSAEYFSAASTKVLSTTSGDVLNSKFNLPRTGSWHDCLQSFGSGDGLSFGSFSLEELRDFSINIKERC